MERVIRWSCNSLLHVTSLARIEFEPTEQQPVACANRTSIPRRCCCNARGPQCLETQQCWTHLRAVRWPQGFECPACQHRESPWLSRRRLEQCRACRRQTSVTAGTVKVFVRQIPPVSVRLCEPACVGSDISQAEPGVGKSPDAPASCAWIWGEWRCGAAANPRNPSSRSCDSTSIRVLESSCAPAGRTLSSACAAPQAV